MGNKFSGSSLQVSSAFSDFVASISRKIRHLQFQINNFSKGEGKYQSFQPILGIQSLRFRSAPITPSPVVNASRTYCIVYPLAYRLSCYTGTNETVLHIFPQSSGVESPENQSVWQANVISLKVDVASYFWVIDYVYYEADWLNGKHQIFCVQPNYTDVT